MQIHSKYYLFSIDLEDVREMIPNGMKYREAVVKPTLQYLDWLDTQQMKCTFFVVGTTAQAFPDLVREIYNRGHEVACHSQQHIHITKLTAQEFERDISENIESLMRCGVDKILGFRAPTFSMLQPTRWAYAILHKVGIRYSSSVLPSKNPIFGWANFGSEKWMDGVYEIPMNVGPSPLSFPFGGGVYFRCFPASLLKLLFNRAAKNKEAVLGYFHPYDINTEQEHFMHPHLNGNWFLNELMYVNRSVVFSKLDNVLGNGWTIIRYDNYYEKRTT